MMIRKKKGQVRKPVKKKRDYLWTRKAKNSLIVKEKDRKKIRDMFILLGFVALFGGMLLILVWLRFKPLFTGYEIQALEMKKDTLIEEQHKLLCSREHLRQLGCIEAKARRDLGMIPVDPGQVVYIKLVRDKGQTASDGQLIAAMAPVERGYGPPPLETEKAAWRKEKN
jgi:hypothetical protein